MGNAEQRNFLSLWENLLSFLSKTSPPPPWNYTHNARSWYVHFCNILACCLRHQQLWGSNEVHTGPVQHCVPSLKLRVKKDTWSRVTLTTVVPFIKIPGDPFLSRESIHEVIGSTQGWLVCWLVEWCYCTQMSLVMRRRFISSGDFDGASLVLSRYTLSNAHVQTLSKFITHLKMTNYLKRVTYK